ncbi:hypothetical protein L6452_36681 [Arctium lappa]|uniref:Uncharacterized protein n=1 Tax=Arctium lappa TaxID=4217 RepID=A0ACB8YAJ1_ARCLA|nr:hypothetical protein L6452_36681 [Arctium lappa]
MIVMGFLAHYSFHPSFLHFPFQILSHAPTFSPPPRRRPLIGIGIGIGIHRSFQLRLTHGVESTNPTVSIPMFPRHTLSSTRTPPPCREKPLRRRRFP